MLVVAQLLFNAQPHLTIAQLFAGHQIYISLYHHIIAYGTAFSGGKTNHDNKSYDFIILYLQAFHQPAHERWTKS